MKVAYVGRIEVGNLMSIYFGHTWDWSSWVKTLKTANYSFVFTHKVRESILQSHWIHNRYLKWKMIQMFKGFRHCEQFFVFKGNTDSLHSMSHFCQWNFISWQQDIWKKKTPTNKVSNSARNWACAHNVQNKLAFSTLLRYFR